MTKERTSKTLAICTLIKSYNIVSLQSLIDYCSICAVRLSGPVSTLQKKVPVFVDCVLLSEVLQNQGFHCSKIRMRGTESILQEGIFVIISEANLLHVVPCSFRLPTGKRIVCLEQPLITAKTVSTQGTSFLYLLLCHVTLLSRS